MKERWLQLQIQLQMKFFFSFSVFLMFTLEQLENHLTLLNIYFYLLFSFSWEILCSYVETWISHWFQRSGYLWLQANWELMAIVSSILRLGQYSLWSKMFSYFFQWKIWSNFDKNAMSEIDNENHVTVFKRSTCTQIHLTEWKKNIFYCGKIQYQ